MFSKKKIVPVTRSRFAKAKPKIVPKNSQSADKNKEEIPKNLNGEKEPSTNENAQEVPNVSLESLSKEGSPANNEDSNKSSEISSELKISKDVEKSLKSVLSPQKEVSASNGYENSVQPVAVDSTVSVSRVLSSPNASQNIEEMNNNTSEEHHNFSPSKEQPNKICDSGKKALPSPAKTSVVNATDKSLKYPCLTKILTAPKKRPQNKEMNERKKKMSSFKELPPRNEITFTDLIYWNPNTEPMKKKEKKLTIFDQIEKEPAEDDMGEEEDEDDEDVSIAPKLLVNENGEIMVDESSLVKERKKSYVNMAAEAIIIDDSEITYATFRRKVSKKWSPRETINFYKALSVIGTDFALMESIIPNRTRRELKIKFKKEEKINMELLHRAMYETDTFQTDLSVEGLDLDVIEIPGLEECIADDAMASNGKKSRKRKNQVLSEIANNDESNENEPRPEKRGRGRPKGKKNANSSTAHVISPSVHSIDGSVESSPTTRGIREEALPRGSIESSENGVRIEEGEASPILRKKKTRILSQDSQENADEYCEIQVQVNSFAENGNYNDNLNTSLQSPSNLENGIEENGVNMDICTESSINPEESPTQNNDIATSTEICSQNNTVSSVIKKEKLTVPSKSLSTGPQTPSNKQTENTCTTQSSSSESSNKAGVKATYKRGRKLNVKPNVKLPKSKNESPLSKEIKNENQIKGVDPESLAVISILDEQVLSEGATDVVTTPPVSRRQKAKGNLDDIKRSLPSALSYTPVVDPVTAKDEPRFVKHSEQKNYSLRNKSPAKSASSVNYFSNALVNIPSNEFAPVLESPSCIKLNESSSVVGSPSHNVQSCNLISKTEKSSVKSTESPVMVENSRTAQSNLISDTYNPARMPCVQYIESSPVIGSPSCTYQTQKPMADHSSRSASSSPFVTTLNASKERMFSIPITPEMCGGKEGVMFVNASPNGKSYHFFMSKKSVGNMPLTAEILSPPSRARMSTPNPTVEFINLNE